MKTWNRYLPTLVMVSLTCLGIAIVVQLVWCGLELLIEGEIMPSISDSIIGVILVISLYLNVELFKLLAIIRKVRVNKPY